MHSLIQLFEHKPLVVVHLAAAVAALVLGAVLLSRRKGNAGHRSLGWAWVALMATAALTTVFIRDYKLPNIAGYTPIHLLSVYVAIALPLAVRHARRGNIRAHRLYMKFMYAGGCVVAGLFTLLPNRYLGGLLWRDLLGVVA
jgi:uncharacterized membrane protein